MTMMRTTTEAGFTLFEALAALTVAAMALGALSDLTHSTLRSVRDVETRVALLQTARKAFVALPPRSALSPGGVTGILDDSRWRVNVSPYAQLPGGGGWLPERVSLEVRAPDGAFLSFDTVRLRKRGPP